LDKLVPMEYILYACDTEYISARNSHQTLLQ